MCIVAFNMFGGEKGNGNDHGNKGNNQKRVPLQLEKTSSKIRPLSLIHNDEELGLEGYWAEGVIVLSFVESEGCADIRLTGISANECSELTFETSAPIYINVGYPEETLRIEITTSAGNGYEGYLVL